MLRPTVCSARTTAEFDRSTVAETEEERTERELHELAAVQLQLEASAAAAAAATAAAATESEAKSAAAKDTESSVKDEDDSATLQRAVAASFDISLTRIQVNERVRKTSFSSISSFLF